MELTRLEFYVADISAAYLPKAAYKINGVVDAQALLSACWSSRISWLEEFYVMGLNAANHVLGIYHVASGGLDSCHVDARVLFQIALGCKAKSLILAHNHPSGNLLPSDSDKQLTKRFKAIGDLLGIKILDHLILTPDPEKFYSFCDEGFMNEKPTQYHYVYDSINAAPERVVF